MQKLKGYLKKSNGEITGIGSTETPDRDGEIIRQDGWDLANFLKNPVLLASHNHGSFPIGKVKDIAIEGGKLVFKAIFSKATQEAKEAYELVKEGILNTFSVGFIPRERDENNPDIITRSELLEISLVSIPANPDAIVLAKGLKKNALAKGIVKSFEEREELKQEIKQEVLEELEPKAEPEKPVEEAKEEPKKEPKEEPKKEVNQEEILLDELINLNKKDE